MAVTSGLSVFAGREIEVESASLDLATAVQRAANLAVYLVENGTMVRDGDTIGSTEAERIIVRQATSRRFADLSVIRATS